MIYLSIYDSCRINGHKQIPNWLRGPIASLLRACLNDNRKAALLLSTQSGGLSVREYWEAIADKKEIEEVTIS